MDEVEIARLISDVRHIIVSELRGTIPPSIDVMRALRFDNAAEKSVQLCIDRLSNEEEADRQARAYGWEMGNAGHSGKLVEMVTTSPENPFLDPDWKSRITREEKGI